MPVSCAPVTTYTPPSDTNVAENLETHDYLREGDVGFKKPKANFTSLLCVRLLNYHTDQKEALIPTGSSRR